MKKLSCGIDFGTSNTSAGVAQQDGVRLIPLEGPHETIPSAMFFRPYQAPAFGRQAIDQFLQREEGRFMRSLKRVLGTSLMQHGTVINRKHWRFENIIASFLKNVKDTMTGKTGEDIKDVVMGRP